MGQRFRTDQFLPPGFEFDRTEVTGDKVILFIRSTRIEADCPLCGASSGHVHSHHVRKPADLPVAGYRVELRVSARQFRCGNSGCNKRFFAERLGDIRNGYLFGCAAAVAHEGLNHREAARRFNNDPRTIKKMMSFSVPPG